MKVVSDLLIKGKKEEIWKKYCGFTEISVEEFMDIQKSLLMEQIDRLWDSELGRKIIGEKKPKSVEEFQKYVKLTDYNDYLPYLSEKNEEVLPEKPYMWVHTSGKTGEFSFKWIPYTKKMYEVLGSTSFSVFILCSARWRGDVRLEIGDKCLYTVAPPPYISGVLVDVSVEQFDFKLIPDPAVAKKMDFFDRIKEGMKGALAEGIDFFFGLSSILIKISDQLVSSNKAGSDKEFKKELMRLPIIARLLKGKIKSLLKGRPMLPKDLWKVKGIFCTGSDTVIYRDKIKKYWGKEPLEAYGSTEFGDVANQSWNTKGLLFHPNNNFYEFIPLEDYYKMRSEPGYKPPVYTLDKVEADKEYALVGTNFHGGILTRYVIGDIIKIISTSDEVNNVYVPQMVFSTRADDIIDIGGFTRLTEKIIWKAIENIDFPYVDWTARKEYLESKPVLTIYIEFKDDVNVEKYTKLLHEELKRLDKPYRELEEFTGIFPLRVVPLNSGTFARYIERRKAEGADLAHLKPEHINPSNAVMEILFEMNDWKL